jgi:hypothetical protein
VLGTVENGMHHALATTQDRWKKSQSYFFQEYSVLDF